VMAVVVLALLWTAESMAPMFVGRQRRLSHAGTNLGLAALNGGIGLAFAAAVTLVAAWAQVSSFGLLHALSLPVWLNWLAALLLFDCWQYWWHRINHRFAFLWRFHAVHHADAEMDVSSGIRFHTGEIILSFGARLVVVPLLGLTMGQVLVYEAIALPIILFHHSNIRLSSRADRMLRWLIVTPWMHVVHHSRWQPETDSNYSSLLSVWDRLFGSFRLPLDPRKISLGLAGWAEREWRTLPGILAAPFRKSRASGGDTTSGSSRSSEA